MLKARAISPTIVSTAQVTSLLPDPQPVPICRSGWATRLPASWNLHQEPSSRASRHQLYKSIYFIPHNPLLDMEVLPAVAAWAASYVYRFPSVAENAFGQRSCSRAAIDVQELASRLSSKAQVLVAGDKGFDETSRGWNIFDQPKPGVIVIPGAALDVAATVSSLSHACPRCIAKRVKTRSNMQMSTARRFWPSGASMELPVRSASFRAASKSP